MYSGGKLLKLSGVTQTEEEGNEKIKKSLLDGSALEKFCCMLRAQGVHRDVAEQLKIANSIDEVLNTLPKAKYQTPLLAQRNGCCKVKHNNSMYNYICHNTCI